MKKVSLTLAIMLLVSCLSCAFTGVAFAASETVYSSVLYNLSKDEAFDVKQVAKAASEADNTEMYVFQIAESNAGELFLYVYQQSEDKFTASEVRISQTVGENVAPIDYKLTLLDRSAMLVKYKVDGFSVSSEADRMYYIIQIARPWDKDIDGASASGSTVTSATTGTDNKISTVAYPVAKQFRAITINGAVQYAEAHEDVITITAKYCGYIRNFAGWVVVASERTDSHFIAFDTDIPIDKLIEATVTYDYILYKEDVVTLTGTTIPQTRVEYPDTKVTGVEKTVKAETEVQTPVIGLFGKTYSWNEIQSVDEFLELEELTDEVREQVTGKKWVLRFALTEVVDFYNPNVVAPATFERYATQVNDASILSLKFITNGVTYDLGVVDNKQTEGHNPSNPNPDSNFEETIKKFDDLWNNMKDIWDKIVYGFNWLAEHWWYILIGIAVIAFVAGLIVAFAKYGIVLVLKILGKVLWFALKWTVLLPFTLLYYGIKASLSKGGK